MPHRLSWLLNVDGQQTKTSVMPSWISFLQTRLSFQVLFIVQLFHRLLAMIIWIGTLRCHESTDPPLPFTPNRILTGSRLMAQDLQTRELEAHKILWRTSGTSPEDTWQRLKQCQKRPCERTLSTDLASGKVSLWYWITVWLSFFLDHDLYHRHKVPVAT